MSLPLNSLYTGGTCNNFKKVCSQFLKFNRTQDAICVTKAGSGARQKMKFQTKYLVSLEQGTFLHI